MGLPGYSDFVEIARGGDSVVYRARQNALDRLVAVKTVDIAETSGGARFTRELEITLGLGRQHPHIVTVIDTGTTSDGRAAIVMEYHELGSLHDRLVATGPLPVTDVIKAAAAVADALDFAHSQGILHRDVKPQNVLVLPTSYVLADFGIARMADAGHTASLERFSYRHASPQVLDGVPPTEADDIWSLGSTLFTLLDGRAPFGAEDPADDTALAYLGRVRRGERRALRRDDLPARLAALVDACLAPAPEQRPSMAHLRHEVAALAGEQWAWQPGGAPVVSTGQDAAPTPTPPAPTPTPVAPEPPVPSVPDPTPPVSTPETLVAAVAPSTSAVAHFDPTPSHGASQADAEPTGLVPQADTQAAAEEDEPRARTLRRLIAVIAVAVLVGLTVGVLVKVAGSSEDPVGNASTPTKAAPVPTASGTPTGATVTAKPYDIGNPKLAPADVQIEDRGSSVLLRWTDPTKGAATFVIVDATTDANKAVQQVASGTTSTTVEGIDPTAREVCFQVAAIVVQSGVQDSGASRKVCRQRD
ncbi:probable serine/threonine-protein kinase transcriptional regulatoryprotein pknk (protein kinase k) (stpk k) [Janibacter sp. HTCC2649]|nr:probable serine/threonine-protein kinase transcriptional regulatoryprotein pknk (protein kinase k) (stpk k) [Janibacter sp. HTCC2649]